MLIVSNNLFSAQYYRYLRLKVIDWNNDREFKEVSSKYKLR